MATKILIENSRTTQVEATAVNGEFEYQVSYAYEGKELRRLSCNINKVTEDGNRTFSGYMSLEGGNKAMNFPVDIEITPHIIMFENILSEVKAAILA